MEETAIAPQTWHGIRQKYFDDRVSALESCAKAGMSMAEAATALGVERTVICGFIRSNSLDIKFTIPPVRSGPCQAILTRRTDLSKTGISVTQGAKKEGITVGTLRAYSEIHGLKWTSKHRYWD